MAKKAYEQMNWIEKIIFRKTKELFGFIIILLVFLLLYTNLSYDSVNGWRLRPVPVNVNVEVKK